MEILKWVVVTVAAIGVVLAAINTWASYLDLKKASVNYPDDVRMRIVSAMSVRRSMLVLGVILTLLVLAIVEGATEDEIIIPMVLYCSIMELIDRNILRSMDNGSV